MTTCSGRYLDDPMRLFIPARIVLAIIYVVAGALLARVIAMQAGHGLPTLIAAMAVFALVCEHLIPLVLIRQDPERVLEATLPAFHAVERLLRPVTLALLRVGRPPDPVVNGGDGASLSTAASGDPVAPADRANGAGDPDRRPRPGAAAFDRRLSRHAGPRGDDAATRHRRHRRQRVGRRAPPAVPRPAVFAGAGLRRDARQHRRFRVRQGPRPLHRGRAAEHPRAAPSRPLRARDQEGARAAAGVPAGAGAERHRRRRVRRHRRPGHFRGSDRGDCRRDPRRVRRRGRAGRRRRPRRVRRQRQGRRVGARAPVRRGRSSAPDSTRWAVTCWPPSAGCRPRANGSMSTAWRWKCSRPSGGG